MRIDIRITLLLLSLATFATKIIAQPANDDCGNPFNIVYSPDSTLVVFTSGDSRGATASTTPLIGSCSASFFTDDTWYTFTTPSDLPNGFIVIRGYFGDVPATDIPGIGMALYASCDAGETSIQCFSANDATLTRMQIPAKCLLANHTYSLRVWSTGNTTATEGTFRLGVYPVLFPPEHILWEDSFASDPFQRGWTTFGICVIQPDSSVNAVWDYLPDASIQPGAFTPATQISSESTCDGAVGVNSDFNDSKGDANSVGMGSVPTALNASGNQSSPATYVIQTPSIYTRDWDVSGITLTFNQETRSLNSTFSLSYRTRREGDPWLDWTDVTINEDVVPNDNPTTHSIRQFLPGAVDGDSLQIKITYLAHYYYWIIDDFQIIETECTNTRVQKNFFAIAPFSRIPADQLFPFAGLSDIYNAGSCDQSNVSLNYTIKNAATNEVFYDEDLAYGTVGSDSVAQNKLFPELVHLPQVDADYVGTYHLTQDSADFDASDNVLSYSFSVGGDTFALDNGFTRSIAVNNALYTPGAPLSFTYGNIFQPVVDAKVDFVTWGVSNAPDMAGKTVSVYLLDWTDTNNDQIAEAEERTFVGFKDYTFTGTEGTNAIIQTELENFDSPGDPIKMEGGHLYMIVVEYSASLGTDPQFFLLADDKTNYSAQELAMDTAVAKGIAAKPVYFTVLGFSPDGNVANIDYEVKELDVNDNRIFFGNDIVPVIRIVKQFTEGTNDPLSSDNIVTAYPNPTTDELKVKLDLSKPYKDIQLRLINHFGQTVYSRIIANTFKDQVETIKTNTLSSGSYILLIETQDGQRSLPIVVIK